MGKKTAPCKMWPSWTTARFWSFIRSSLRAKMRSWPPKVECKKKSRHKYVGSNKRQKWEYECCVCHGMFMDKDVEANHIIPAGTLKCFDDLPAFVENLFCAEDGFEIVCKPCHKLITAQQKEAKKNEKV